MSSLCRDQDSPDQYEKVREMISKFTLVDNQMQNPHGGTSSSNFDVTQKNIYASMCESEEESA